MKKAQNGKKNIIDKLQYPKFNEDQGNIGNRAKTAQP